MQYCEVKPAADAYVTLLYVFLTVWQGDIAFGSIYVILFVILETSEVSLQNGQTFFTEADILREEKS